MNDLDATAIATLAHRHGEAIHALTTVVQRLVDTDRMMLDAQKELLQAFTVFIDALDALKGEV